MYKLFLLIILYFFISTTCLGGNRDTRFFEQYPVVQNQLKNNEGYYNELNELRNINPGDAEFIANFWYERASSQYDEQINNSIKYYAKLISRSQDENRKKKYEEELKARIYHFFYCYYYDHWNEINNMIVGQYKLAKSKN